MNFSLKLVSSWQRLLLLIPASLILLGVINGFSWFFAHSLAVNAVQPEAAVTAVYLAPSDAFAHSQLAAFKTRSFVPADLPEATREAELATALAPNDYRYWFALTRMRERTGDTEGAERAAQRAVELAPHNAQVLWLCGNILLRRGRQEEGLQQMRRAAEADSQFAIHFVDAAAEMLKTDDLSNLRQTIGDNSKVRAALTTYLTQTKKLEAATIVWTALPEVEKRETGERLLKVLLADKKYRAAKSFYDFFAANESEKPQLEQFLNGGFENEMAASETNLFAWQIAPGAQPQIALFASTKHTGERSLIIIFNSLSATDFRSITQTVAVESNSEYHFETWFKTEKLQSGNTVFWEVIDATDNRGLAKTVNIPINDNDWQKLSADFKTSEATEAVTFRFARVACAQQTCLITGKVWFDDFTLRKIEK